MLTNKDLDEMEAQLDSSVPYYVPALITEIRRLRATALGGASPAEPPITPDIRTRMLEIVTYAQLRGKSLTWLRREVEAVEPEAHVPSPVSSTGVEQETVDLYVPRLRTLARELRKPEASSIWAGPAAAAMLEDLASRLEAIYPVEHPALIELQRVVAGSLVSDKGGQHVGPTFPGRMPPSMAKHFDKLLRDSSPRTGAQDVAAGTVHLRCPCGQEIDIGTTQPITVRWLTARRDSSPRTGAEGWPPFDKDRDVAPPRPAGSATEKGRE